MTRLLGEVKTVTHDQLVGTLRVVSGLIADALNGAEGTTAELLAHAHEAIATTLSPELRASHEDEKSEPSLEALKRMAVRLRSTAPDNASLVDWAAERIEELEHVFDLRWKADMRAIERWRKANPGNELVLADHADLCVWLLEQLRRTT